MELPIEAMIISGGSYYGVSKSWFEQVNPDKATMFFSITVPNNVSTVAANAFRDSYSSEKKNYGAVTSNDNLGRYNAVSYTHLVEIETCGEYCKGATVADTLGLSGKKPNVSCVMDVDREAFDDYLVAVSYTHLDVYTRQKQGLSQRRRCQPERGLLP